MIKIVFASLALVVTLVGLTADAHAQSFSGRWYCVQGCQIPNGRAVIEQRGDRLTLYNEVGQVSRGYLEDPRTVVAVDWRVTGRISGNGGAIIWRNGSRWVR